MRGRTVSKISTIGTWLFALLLPQCSNPQCSALKRSTCSYTGLNGSCTVYIDRSLPATPPTIYARHGSNIKVVVMNTSPFEGLSLDFTSAKIIIPTDAFQAFMTNQSGNLQKFSIVDLSQGRLADDGSDDPEVTLKKISAEQSNLYSDFDISTLFPVLVQLMSPTIPTSACADAENFRAHSKDQSNSLPPNPWYNFAAWKQSAEKLIGSDRNGQVWLLADLSVKIKAIDINISSVNAKIATLSASDQATLKPYADVVAQNQSNIKARSDLLTWIEQLSPGKQQDFVISDTSHGRLGWVQASWNLDAINSTTAVAKRAATTPYKPAQTSDIILSPAAKQAITSVTVQYQSEPRVEFATGVMVPLRPFHTYSVASTASNGAVTGSIVQETLTYTIVPLALVNVNLVQGVSKRQPIAASAAIGTGYNPATSAVEFGTGLTLSWKYLQFGFLADIGRDQEIAGGFYVGEPLPASNPPKPLTNTLWTVRPAFSLSVRIPVTGAAK